MSKHYDSVNNIWADAVIIISISESKQINLRKRPTFTTSNGGANGSNNIAHFEAEPTMKPIPNDLR